MRPSIKRNILVALTLAGGLLSTAAHAQTPAHIYELNGSYTDSLGGPALQPAGGTLGPTGYTFTENQGPSLSNAINPNVYSLEMYFSLSNIVQNGSSYRSLINFKNLGTDNGLYYHNGSLVLYQGGIVATSPTPVFSPNTLAHLIVTRNASNQFVGYLNGVEQFTFADVSGTTTFSETNAIAWFLNDNGAEEPEGFLDFLRVYDAPLTQAQVSTRYQAVTGNITVPEPGTVALLGTGLLGLTGAVMTRRKRA